MHINIIYWIHTMTSSQKNKCTYQFMNELFPAEWLPINSTVIFFRGARSRRFNFSAILINPKWRKAKDRDEIDRSESILADYDTSHPPPPTPTPPHLLVTVIASWHDHMLADSIGILLVHNNSQDIIVEVVVVVMVISTWKAAPSSICWLTL